MTCSHCIDAEDLFTERMARRDLRRYRMKGPRKSTRLLLDAIRSLDSRDATLLDIGGGVGAIPYELVGSGFSSATYVEAATAYVQAAKDEAERQGLSERVSHYQGDFVDLAPNVASADVVTLDRVICCYPDMPRLVELSAAKAKRLYGLVFPRERWFARLGIALGNLYFRIRRSTFRAYVHPSRAVDAAVRRSGFGRRYYARTLLWHVVVYTRTSDSD